MKNLLIEIGTEEIPASYIKNALDFFANKLEEELKSNAIDFGKKKLISTPRRLSCIISDVATSQKQIEEEIIGPPARVAFDKDNKALAPAIKFAEKLSIPLKQIKIKSTPKGEYLFAIKKKDKKSSIEILSSALPKIILSLPFPKTMKWASLDIYFARPIVNILAILGSDIIPFKLGNLESSNLTFGHRFLAPYQIEIKDEKEYLNKLEKAFVIGDSKKRKNIIKDSLNKLAKEKKGKIQEDNELLDTINNLVEFVVPTLGSFDKKFLKTPKEILITAMKKHQKYFPIFDDKDKLLPYFIAINNTEAKNMDVVKEGHERVLRARLSDAEFFYNTDSKIKPEEFCKRLDAVIFHKDIGSVLDKTKRMEKIAQFLSQKTKSKLKDDAKYAAKLSKFDLVSQAVIEFTELQGTMARIYAQKWKVKKSIAVALEEQYMPTASGAKIPSTYLGSILSIADKTDSLCALFKAGEIPTGTNDPFALRRQTIGIIRILKENNITLSLGEIINFSLSLLNEKNPKIKDDILNFFKARILNILLEEGYTKSNIDAILETDEDSVPAIWEKCSIIKELKDKQDFLELCASFKRIFNIIKKEDKIEDKVQKKLFEKEEEIRLFEAFEKIQKEILKKKSFKSSLLELAKLKPFIDDFFDKVMVMTDDLKVRKNRFALLNKIFYFIKLYADFSKVS